MAMEIASWDEQAAVSMKGKKDLLFVPALPATGESHDFPSSALSAFEPSQR